MYMYIGKMDALFADPTVFAAPFALKVSAIQLTSCITVDVWCICTHVSSMSRKCLPGLTCEEHALFSAERSARDLPSPDG